MLSIVVYLILVGLGITFAILYTQYQVALFIGVLLLFPAISAIIALIQCLFLKVDIMGEERHAHRDDEFNIYIKIKNPTIIPITYGSINFSFKYDVLGKWNQRKLSFQLKARDETVCVLKMKSEYCGTIGILIKRVWIKDFFRTFGIPKRIRQVHQQVILPRLDILSLKVQKNISFYNDEYEEFFEDHPGNDPSEVFDVRDYREGDKLQRVHWKLSSKKDKLMVKEFSDPIVINTVVICDNIAYYSYRDKKMTKEINFLKEWSLLIEKTVQASYTLLMQQIIHYVYWFDEEQAIGIKREIRNVEDFDNCMHELLQSSPYKSVDKYMGYLLYSEEIHRYGNVFYVGKYNSELFVRSGISAKVVE